jgi:hypothetical protein
VRVSPIESTGPKPTQDHPGPSRTDRRSELEAAIARLTRALATADDDTIADLVAERRAMRAELEEMSLRSLPSNVRKLKAGS